MEARTRAAMGNAREGKNETERKAGFPREKDEGWKGGGREQKRKRGKRSRSRRGSETHILATDSYNFSDQLDTATALLSLLPSSFNVKRRC